MDRQATEVEIGARLGAGDPQGAAAQVVRAFDPEILGWLRRVQRDPDSADEIFGAFCEALCGAIADFRGQSSFRTWAYALAHHARAHHLRDPYGRRGRPLLSADMSGVEAAVRSATRPWQQTDVKDAFAALRDALDPDDLSLLVLRVDRRLPWDEIAVILADGPLDPVARRQRAAALRQRFQRLKAHLEARAAEVGLISRDR